MVLVLALVGVGLLVGLIVGLWWALIAAAGLGALMAASEEIELEGWFVGVLYAGLAAVGIGLGILVRRLAKRGVRPS
jgi:hypothetical protein